MIPEPYAFLVRGRSAGKNLYECGKCGTGLRRCGFFSSKWERNSTETWTEMEQKWEISSPATDGNRATPQYKETLSLHPPDVVGRELWKTGALGSGGEAVDSGSLWEFPLTCPSCQVPLTFIALLTDPEPVPEDDFHQSFEG